MKSGTSESLFALATRVCGNVVEATDEDLNLLKGMLREYTQVIDEDLSPLRVSTAFEVTDTHVTFGVNTSGMSGSDFYLTVRSDSSVLYSDGMDENDMPLDRPK